MTTEFTEGDDLPVNEEVLLITGITGIFHTPEVITGTTSSTGKTISVTLPNNSSSFRLDTAKILSGSGEFRHPKYFEIYTPNRLQRRQQSNCQPGPRAGTNSIQAIDELPDPTHYPADEEPFKEYTQ